MECASCTLGTTYTDLWVTALAYNAVNEDTRMWLETQLKFEIDPRAFSWIIIYSLVFLRGKIRHDTFVIVYTILRKIHRCNFRQFSDRKTFDPLDESFKWNYTRNTFLRDNSAAHLP